MEQKKLEVGLETFLKAVVPSALQLSREIVNALLTLF